MIRVQQDPFDIGAEISALTAGRTDLGAMVSFTGLVRDFTGDDTVSKLTLEHYPGMTEKELARIEAEATTRFDLNASLIIHRVGTLAPGDEIVLVVACSAHRDAAFDGARFMMDFLKTQAPFWKKEAGAGDEEGGGKWVDARDSDDDAAKGWS